VTVRRADVDGDGHRDLILLYARLGHHRSAGAFVPTTWTLSVLRADGGRLTRRLGHPMDHPAILRVRNVNTQRGAELFIHNGGTSSGQTVDVYAFDGNRLRRAHRFLYRGDSLTMYGFTCRRHPAWIIQHAFLSQSSRTTGARRRTDTTYRWVGARLERTAKHTTERHGPLPKRLTTADC
jgi:hypothetical protein